MGKKNLDKLFQEKLKDVSGIPDENVWQSIEMSLNEKKKKRRILPLWWKLGGVAAVLAIAFFAINPFKSNQNINGVTDSTIEKVDKLKQEVTPEKTAVTNTFTDTNSAVVESSGTNEINIQTNENKITSINQPNKKINTTNTVQKHKKESRYTLTQKQNVNTIATQITSTKESQNKLDLDANKNNRKPSEILINKALSAKNTEKNISKENQGRNLENISKIGVSDSTKEGMAEVDTHKEKELVKEEKKKSIFDEIADQEPEESIAKNENKWSAGPNLAPVYYNGIGSGSPIDPVFDANSKSGAINYSYGVSVAYQVNKKLSIRSGINKVDYGYDTNDVIFSSSVQASANRKIGTIDFSTESKNIVVTSNVASSNSNLDAITEALSFNNTSSDISTESSAVLDGLLSQQIGYLEVPLELNYALLDKRFGVNLIGGVSSLFLVDNSIRISRNELTAEVGEANNINEFNFSTNVGLGLNYKVTPKIQFNLEPIFKYQLNTFSATENSFKPYSVGIYSGLNFKF